LIFRSTTKRAALQAGSFFLRVAGARRMLRHPAGLKTLPSFMTKETRLSACMLKSLMAGPAY
jgi:hypothetical protein